MSEADKTSWALKVLDAVYDQAIQGLPGMESAAELAESYKRPGRSVDRQVEELIRWQLVKAGTTGFVTGLGGLMTLPVAISANLGATWYIQLRMIAAIAHLGGFDVRSDQVRSLAYACMCGNAAGEVLRDVGIKAGQAVTQQLINQIPKKVLGQINKAVNRKLVSKFSEKGILQLGRLVPLVGGLIGGAFDTVTTRKIGEVACRVFLEGNAGDIPRDDAKPDLEGDPTAAAPA